MSSLNRLALAALALCASTQAAGATYEAYSSLTNLQYTLTDLRPDDGIAASVSFSTSGNFAFVGGLTVIDNLVNDTQVDLDIQSAPSPFDGSAISTFLRSDNTSAGGFVEGSTLAANVRLVKLGQGFYAEATAAAVNVEFTADLDDTVLQPIQDTVVLAPHSQLTLTGLAKYGLVRLGGGSCEDCVVSVEAMSVLLGSEVFPQFSDPTQDDALFDEFERVEGLYDSFGINQVFADGLPDQSATKQLSLTFVNDSDEVKRFGFLATTWVQAQTTPVPEPETWGLAFVGLLLAGAAARRRQR